ncbi:hypothetical protein DAMA08_030410 [Martiniozyma asiatica (nom. inval.)]|nr:hypothetical protein DAMA08_030410 [Martiniozyma asiatica]
MEFIEPNIANNSHIKNGKTWNKFGYNRQDYSNLLLSKNTTNYEICMILKLIIQDSNPPKDLLPLLLKLLSLKFKPLWSISNNIKNVNFDELNPQDVQLPLAIEKFVIANKKMFVYITLSIVHIHKLNKIDLILPNQLLIGALSTLRINDYTVKMASLELLMRCNFRKIQVRLFLIPVILNLIEVFNDDPMMFDQIIKSYSLPDYINPLYLLEIIIEQSDENISVIKELTINDTIEKLFSMTCEIVEKYYNYHYQIPFSVANRLSSLFRTCSLVCSINNQLTIKITSSWIGKFCCHVISQHYNMLSAIGKIKLSDETKEIYKISQNITIASLSLVKVISRESDLLRTFIREHPFAQLFIKFLEIEDISGNEIENKNDLKIRQQILQICANSIIEFIIEDESPGINLLELILNKLKEKPDAISLLIVKNAMHAPSNHLKNIIKNLPIKIIFDYCSVGDLEIQRQAVEVLRNLIATCESYNFNEYTNDVSFINWIFNELNYENIGKLKSLLYLLLHLSNDCIIIFDNDQLLLLENIFIECDDWEIRRTLTLIMTSVISTTDSKSSEQNRINLISRGWGELLNYWCDLSDDVDFQEKARFTLFKLKI